MTKIGKSETFNSQKIFLIIGCVAALTTILIAVSSTTAFMSELNMKIEHLEKIHEIQTKHLESKFVNEINEMKQMLKEKDAKIDKLRLDTAVLTNDLVNLKNRLED